MVASDHFVSTEYQPSHDQDSLASWLLTSVINMLVLLPPVSTSTWWPAQWEVHWLELLFITSGSTSHRRQHFDSISHGLLGPPPFAYSTGRCDLEGGLERQEVAEWECEREGLRIFDDEAVDSTVPRSFIPLLSAVPSTNSRRPWAVFGFGAPRITGIFLSMRSRDQHQLCKLGWSAPYAARSQETLPFHQCGVKNG